MSQESPSNALAKQITERLTEAGLIRDTERDQLQQKLAAGMLRSEDWRLAIELADEQEY
jgi:hypothetical protein